MVGDQTAEHQWVVDPLDGTVNYFYGIPHFCTSIALRYQGEVIVGVIYDPMRDEMWAAQKGDAPTLNGEQFRVSDARRSRGSGHLGRPFENRARRSMRAFRFCRTWCIARANAG
ncbi:MAG: inositol monophosphatase family protein [Geodermatophilaceae bacterium]